MVPAAYRSLLRDRRTRLLLTGLVSTPLGTAIGGPLVGSLGAAGTLAVSGLATLLLAAAASVMWAGERTDALSQT